MASIQELKRTVSSLSTLFQAKCIPFLIIVSFQFYCLNNFKCIAFSKMRHPEANLSMDKEKLSLLLLNYFILTKLLHCTSRIFVFFAFASH